MKKEFTKEEVNRYESMRTNLEDITSLSLNDVKYLYNNFYTYKKDYLAYRFKKLKYFRNIIKFIYILIMVLFIEAIPVLHSNILILYVYILLSYFGLSKIEKVLKNVLETKYIKDLDLISHKITELQEKESLSYQNTLGKSPAPTKTNKLNDNITPTKDMTLSLKLIRK